MAASKLACSVTFKARLERLYWRAAIAVGAVDELLVVVVVVAVGFVCPRIVCADAAFCNKGVVFVPRGDCERLE